MNKLILAVVGGVVGGAIAFGVFGLKDAPVPVITGGASYANNPEINLNGVLTYPRKQAMAASTSTVCAILSPSATTTLESATAFFTTTGTSTTLVEIARASTAYATTTVVARMSSAGNAAVTVVATNTPASLTDNVVAPNSYIVVKAAGNGLAFSASGTCQAVFQAVN